MIYNFIIIYLVFYDFFQNLFLQQQVLNNAAKQTVTMKTHTVDDVLEILIANGGMYHSRASRAIRPAGRTGDRARRGIGPVSCMGDDGIHSDVTQH